ncbi:LD-carboxypeptidase LdcB/DacB [Streptococcus iners]|uniref:LD-carboxypeptidase LdcB/DacB n=1 Tax=Streptococcus iners TaxID=3028084 RepID=A0AA96VNQ4_9STRE|nr:LD-carboxypeptidase LdcB/DacB [Streptococcus sp. 29887]MCK4025283.1 M15 family metallopeptidase [Streptococcus suis]WNY51961.1 LD-carboxypeptidase LdcB/DacB [Streptococcus sp. 29887]
MKKLTVSLLLCSSMLLASCGAVENQTESSKVSETNQTVKTSESSSQTTSNSNAESSETGDTENSSTQQSTEINSATTATYNGSYYSVQGKYGEVIIANKKHPLAASYAPGEDPQALAAFQQLIADMQAQGFAISNNYSGFRSYETQAGLYQSYVNQDGQAAADTYSARAGYSEHQTGLAFDLIDSAGNLLEEPVASQWLADNAHHYGFIVRYLPGKESSTGYMAETWHVRYIGQEATDIYNSGLTLEEYFGVPGGGYE